MQHSMPARAVGRVYPLLAPANPHSHTASHVALVTLACNHWVAAQAVPADLGDILEAQHSK